MKILFSVEVYVADNNDVSILKLKGVSSDFIEKDIEMTGTKEWLKKLDPNFSKGIYVYFAEAVIECIEDDFLYKVKESYQIMSIQEYKAKYKSKNGIVE